MTTQAYLDAIKQAFPSVSDTQILKDIDRAQKLFATEVGLTTATGQLANITTNFAWTLPAGFRKLIDVRLYDSSGNPIYWGDEYAQISYEIQLGKFYLKSLTSTPITATPSGIGRIILVYETLPTTILTQDTALEIEEEFRDAIEHDVLRKYYAKYPTLMGEGGVQLKDWNAVSYHTKEYEKLRYQAKRYKNSKETTLGDTQNYQFAGRQRLPLRSYDSAYSSTTIGTITALNTIYEKFALYNINTSDTGTIDEAVQVGYTTIAGSKSGVTFTITSTTEFGNDTFIESNNWEVSWVQNSSSEIVVTLPASFTDLSIQLYEFL